jgi:hypothetical protein
MDATTAVAAAPTSGHGVGSASDGLGWLPALSVTGGLGLLAVALADTASRAAAVWAEPVFWAGLLIITAPVLLRLASPHTSRTERLGLVTGFGMALYLVKVLHSPAEFTFYDEFSHWRTVLDILNTHRLFSENPLLPISPMYPGLENVTSALVNLGHLSIFDAGILVIGVARLLLILTLFLLFEQVSDSAHVASIATVLYMANPSFLFFDAQFSYESLVLPVAVFTLYVIARRARSHGASGVGLTVVIWLGLAAVVSGHHLTSYVLAAFLILWAGVAALFGRGADRRGPGETPLLALVGCLAWSAFVASRVIGYLAPHFLAASAELLRLIAGEATARELFRSAAGQAPAWERVTGVVSVALILVVLPFGVRALWRRRRTNPLAAALAVAALGYPASLALRLTESGAEAGVRASEFVFLAVAYVLAIAITDFWLSKRPGRTGQVVFAGGALVLLAGGVILGFAPWSRLPGVYAVAADARSIEPQGVLAAEWARDVLGPENRIVTDRVNRLLMGTYGEQRPVSSYADGQPVARLVLLPQLGADERAIIQQAQVRYVIVDRRLGTAVPMVGVYVESGEPDIQQQTMPLDPAALTKFDELDGVSRVFDSGDIAIYDVSGLAASVEKDQSQ